MLNKRKGVPHTHFISTLEYFHRHLVICPSLCISNWAVKQVEPNLRENCVSAKKFEKQTPVSVPVKHTALPKHSCDYCAEMTIIS